jgi:hypothetical protein
VYHHGRIGYEKEVNAIPNRATSSFRALFRRGCDDPCVPSRLLDQGFVVVTVFLCYATMYGRGVHKVIRSAVVAVPTTSNTIGAHIIIRLYC